MSTEQQNLTAQRDGLHAAGVGDDRIYVDHGLAGRTGIGRACGWAGPRCRSGETLVVTKLDR
jgi:DNA invertase Pin-like site-specific DNA recombinase